MTRIRVARLAASYMGPAEADRFLMRVASGIVFVIPTHPYFVFRSVSSMTIPLNSVCVVPLVPFLGGPDCRPKILERGTVASPPGLNDSPYTKQIMCHMSKN